MPCSTWKGRTKMKIHLLVMTAILSYCITHNCKAQEEDKRNVDKGQQCDTNGDCKSNVCTEKKCAQGNKQTSELVVLQEECESGHASIDHGMPGYRRCNIWNDD